MDSKIMTIFDNKLKQIDKLQKEIDSIRPITIEEIKQLKEYYRIGLTYSSNAIEGNSLTESETKIILEDGITIGGKTLKDHLEVVGHSDAYDYILQLSKNKTIKEKDIIKIHR
jgi:Fic family protein